MFRVTVRNLLARKLRLAMSAFAIVLGVAFVAGSFVFTDTLDKSFQGIIDSTTGDVIIRPAGTDPNSSGQILDTRFIPGRVLDRAASVDGVARLDRNITIPQVFVVSKAGKVIGGQGPPSLGVNYTDTPGDNGEPLLQVSKGRVPTGPGEVALDKVTADKAGYDVGDTVQLVTAGKSPRLSVTLVGIVTYGAEGGLLGATLSVFDTGAMQQLLFNGRDLYTDATVTTADGFSQTQVSKAVSAVLPPAFEAVSGDSVAAESKDSIDQALSFINTFLLVFAAVALVVGSFLIINTFSILVAQRSREMALLRALGASRRQVTRSVLLEALVVGFIGSTVGLLGGFLLAVGLKAIFARVGLDMTGAGLELRPRTVVVSYAVGVIVTLFAAYLPARRASQIAPVAALRDDVALPESTLRRRFITGLAITVIGLALLGVGLFANTSNSLPMVGGGVLGVLVGVSLISPVLGRPLLRLLGFLFRKTFSTVGRLAGQNTLRNPRRTAATASALMIGLALVSAMSIIGASTSSSIDKLIGNEFQSDFVVASSVGSSFSPTIADRIRDIPGVDTAAVFRGLSVKVDGSDTFIGAIDPNEFGKTIDVDMRVGKLSDLTDSTVLVERTQASGDGTVVGDHVTVSLPKHDKTLTVAGTYSGSPIVGANYLVTTKTLAAGGVAPSDSAVYVLKDPDASTAAVGAAIGKLVKDLPTVELQNKAEFTKQQRGQVDKLLAIIYALLGLAVVIAVLGIVNTLALSVIERTREVGLLRAVGMSRRQLRLLVRLESVAISVLGACLGVVMGVVFGVALQRAVADQGIDVLTIPFANLALFIVVAAIVGVLAAVLPARRAARLDILKAIHAE